MNLNDYSSLQNNTSASDSSLYGNGSVYSLTPQAQTGAYGACAYPSRMNASAGVNSNAPSQNRSVYDSGAAGSGVQRQAGGGAPSGSYHQTRNSAQGYDTRINGSSGAQHYRTNYNVVVGEENALLLLPCKSHQRIKSLPVRAAVPVRTREEVPPAKNHRRKKR